MQETSFSNVKRRRRLAETEVLIPLRPNDIRSQPESTANPNSLAQVPPEGGIEEPNPGSCRRTDAESAYERHWCQKHSSVSPLEQDQIAVGRNLGGEMDGFGPMPNTATGGTRSPRFGDECFDYRQSEPVDDVTNETHCNVQTLPTLNSNGYLAVMLKRLSPVLTFERLLGFMSITSLVSLSARQYEFMAAALRTANSNLKMKTYKTLRIVMDRDLVAYFFPSSSIRLINIVPRGEALHRRLPQVRTAHEGDQHPLNCMRIILLSEWVKVDVLTYPFYAEVFENQREDDENVVSVEDTPIVCHLHTALWYDLRL